MLDLSPEPVPPIQTKFRRIVTPLPAPESLSLLQSLAEDEPRSVQTQFPTVWERSVGSQVYDPYGNIWLDWTAGVIAANLGHGRESVSKAIMDAASLPLHHSYVFPTRQRADFSRLVKDRFGYESVLLLTTGSEAVEAAIKLALGHSWKRNKLVIVSFDGAFHGRTMGAQSVGGIASQREWLPGQGVTFVRIPFPSREALDKNFDPLAALQQVEADLGVAAVLLEPYQGSTLEVADAAVARSVQDWCARNGAALIVDEIQAGYGRTGEMFGHYHLGIRPDIICCGKGISNGVPMAMVLSSRRYTERFRPGELSSTHSGNPLGLAAGMAVLREFEDSDILGEAQARGRELRKGLEDLMTRFPELIQDVRGIGLCLGLVFLDARSCMLAAKRTWQSGLLVFTPIGVKKNILKFTPPLTVTAEQIEDGLQALWSAIAEVSREQELMP